ncbi:MAG: bis(5'-nucleosyl)-tetraphosphatase (symmetrical) YqeK [Clostridia bacterium]|nr:bis(5'-nucleosyl)-tetraphosphatase (symmetrical) YqeK [Clostridia bacterium]
MADTDRNEEFIKEIRKQLGDYRFIHSLEVAKSAVQLAKRFGADEEKAYTAGILHDVLKDKSPEFLLDYFGKNGVRLTDVEKSNHKLYHAIAGSIYVEKELGVNDEEIINAIRYHTTGRKNMSLLEKVIYIADFISADRKYDGVERMREKAKISLETAMEEGLQFSIIELSEKLLPIHPDSIDAYNEIIMSKEKSDG